jgi:2-(1,2-epoxy-1,2-dihydrophenyl)acetyl-CoA isomerase
MSIIQPTDLKNWNWKASHFDKLFPSEYQQGGLNMMPETNSYERQDFYLLKRFDDVAMLKFGKNFLFELIDRAIENPLLDAFDRIAKNDKIKVLVIMNCMEQNGCEKYIDFCRQVLESETDRRSIQSMCNVFDQLILKIVRLNKPVIHAGCGEVTSLFLSISLACDYRIIATHTIFQKSYFELETLPKGGCPFFLGKMLGYGQAKKLLMSEKDINALEALEIGMVDQIVPCDNLEETAIQMAQDLTRRSIRSLEGIKRLINYTMQDIQDYLNFESFEFLKTIDDSVRKNTFTPIERWLN